MRNSILVNKNPKCETNVLTQAISKIRGLKEKNSEYKANSNLLWPQKHHHSSSRLNYFCVLRPVLGF